RPDGRGRNVDIGAPGDRMAADRLSALYVIAHDRREDAPGALVELLERSLRMAGLGAARCHVWGTVAGHPPPCNVDQKLICPSRASGYSGPRMATPAHQELLGTDEQELPLRPLTSPSRPPTPRTSSQPGMAPVRPGPRGGGPRRVGL